MMECQDWHVLRNQVMYGMYAADRRNAAPIADFFVIASNLSLFMQVYQFAR